VFAIKRKSIRSETRAQTAKNLEKAGVAAKDTGAKPAKKSSLKVTPRSAHKKVLAEQKAKGKYGAAGMEKNWRKAAGGTRKRKK
jgi:hypothetical protein